MTDQQLLDNTKKIIDACFAAGMIKSAEDARQLVLLFDTLRARLQPGS